jgi:hypothetical protein
VRHRLEAHSHRADLELALLVVLPQVEGILDQVVVAPGTHHAAERVTCPRRRVQHRARRRIGAGPPVHRHRLLARRVSKRVRERDQVEEVVRVEVGDHHRVHVHVVDPLAQLAEHAVPAVDHDRGAVFLEQVARAGAAGVLPRRGLAEDGQPHGPGAYPGCERS